MNVSDVGQPRTPEQPEYAPSIHAARGYRGLRGVARVCSLLSLVAPGAAVLLGVFTVWQGGPGNLDRSVPDALAQMVVGLGMYVALTLISENVSVILDIELNTRRTAILLEQQTQAKVTAGLTTG